MRHPQHAAAVVDLQADALADIAEAGQVVVRDQAEIVEFHTLLRPLPLAPSRKPRGNGKFTDMTDARERTRYR